MPKLTALTAKATPTTSDEVILTDAADSNNTKRATMANLPISTATQTALDLKAPLASPALTGTATAVNLTLSGALTAPTVSGSMAVAGSLSVGSTGSVDNGAGEGFDFSATELKIKTGATERARIDASGNLLVGKTSSTGAVAGAELQASGTILAIVDGAAPVYINRLTDDGTLVTLAQDGTSEGTISVSGTTVSYNGAHLSRWSQFTEAGRPEILRGTILSNLDEMAVWEIEAQDAVLWEEGDELPEGVQVGDIKTPAIEAGFESNEQLNKMEVSSVQGDKNVAGVFQGWDSDDEDNDDFYCAMTGDFVIRIGAGVTVERGDLIQSAGDGTGEPQDDDLVRSKTVAKVTSTNISITYEDGSYCVPCVLMAC